MLHYRSKYLMLTNDFKPFKNYAKFIKFSLDNVIELLYILVSFLAGIHELELYMK